MTLLICGDRNWYAWLVVREAMLYAVKEWGVTHVVHGDAAGADTIGEACAKNMRIPVKAFPANWKKYGKRAGPLRNQQMLDEGNPDVVLAFHDYLPNSKGTGDMVHRALKAGIPTFLCTTHEPMRQLDLEAL